ncbi:MAG: signal peptidase I [Candidatus Wallbacteria bacterium]|nr:signal peptidase I [Candidatus Wallbacteria bacterium]
MFSALAVALILRATVIQAYYIPSASMRDTLLEHDHLLANKAAYWFYPIKRGDIVIFKFPKDNRDFIKRVIGLPGDTVEVRAGKLRINDRAFDEPYLREPMNSSFHPRKVPENMLFVLGDNRNNSDDSRYWGFLPRRNLKAKALLIYYPFMRIKMIRHFNLEGR